jgi:hypothetical protein
LIFFEDSHLHHNFPTFDTPGIKTPTLPAVFPARNNYLAQQLAIMFLKLNSQQQAALLHYTTTQPTSA